MEVWCIKQCRGTKNAKPCDEMHLNMDFFFIQLDVRVLFRVVCIISHVHFFNDVSHSKLSTEVHRAKPEVSAIQFWR